MSDDALPFIGRRDAIDLFHSLQSIRAQVNCLYIQAQGGIGKTRLLRELIATCRSPRWELCPSDSDIDPLIDFSALENRSIAGLRQSIIARLGEDFFADFRASEAELRMVETVFSSEASASIPSSSIFALRQRTDDLFLQGFRKAQRGRRTALFFDTFEIANRRRVGRWFIDQLIANSEGCLIVFAGRPPVGLPRPSLPMKVWFYELLPWNGAEVNAYFDERKWKDPEGEEGMQHLRRVTGGYPLLVDMAIYLRDSSLMTSKELLELPDAQGNESISPEIEIALVRRLLSNQSDEQAIIMDMAYLKRRFDADIFQARQRYNAYGMVTNFDQFIADLISSRDKSREGLGSIIKYRAGDRVLTLHDEAQRMIEEHAQKVTGLWEPVCEELYQKIVRMWYDEAIARAETGEAKYMLRAEQLGYELEHSIDKGIELYKQYSEEVRKHLLFEFNELIWGEVADKIAQNKLSGREYELIYDQADWLWFVGQNDAAADLGLLLTDRYTPGSQNVFRRLDALALLGHAYMHSGKYKDAEIAFDEGLKEAQKIESKYWISAFQQNKGQLLQQTNQWSEANKLFKLAVETAREVDDAEAQALALVNLGRLQGLLGEYKQAILNCERSVALRRYVIDHYEEWTQTRQQADKIFNPIPRDRGIYYTKDGAKSRVGVAYLRLADVYRYSGDPQKARHNYEQALKYLAGLNQFNYESEARQGLGNLSLDLSTRRRKIGDRKAATKALEQAFDQFERSIGLCREYGLRELLPKALHRFAHIILAIGELEAAPNKRSNKRLDTLSQRVSAFLLPEEDVWRRDSRHLRQTGSFIELSTVAKAQRMFEVSSLEAGRSQDVNTMSESLVEACEIALDRGLFEDVRTYARLAHVPTESFQELIFLALIEIILADLDLLEGRTEEAFKGYNKSFPTLAKNPGYGSYLLRDYLDRFIVRLQRLPRKQGLALVDRLIQSWTEQRLDDSHPELFFQLYNYRNQA